MYKVGRRDPEESVKDNERLTKDLKQAFGVVAGKLLREEKDPFSLTDSDLRVRGQRAIRTFKLFEEAGVGYMRRSMHSESMFIKDAFENHSREYAPEKHNFPAVPVKIASYLNNDSPPSSFDVDNKNTLQILGYWNANAVPRSNASPVDMETALYIFWHEQDFDHLEGEGTNHQGSEAHCHFFYPKDMLEERNKNILRLLIKKYCEVDFKSFLERLSGENLEGQTEGDSYSDKIDFDHRLRNFARFPVTFPQSYRSFQGKKGYVQEIKNLLATVTYEHSRLKKLVEAVNNMGGCAKVMEVYLKESLQDIANKVLLNINGDDGDKAALQYILDNTANFDYTYLYGGTHA
jgi:hypothetical protein